MQKALLRWIKSLRSIFRIYIKIFWCKQSADLFIFRWETEVTVHLFEEFSWCFLICTGQDESNNSFEFRAHPKTVAIMMMLATQWAVTIKASRLFGLWKSWNSRYLASCSSMFCSQGFYVVTHYGNTYLEALWDGLFAFLAAVDLGGHHHLQRQMRSCCIGGPCIKETFRWRKMGCDLRRSSD